MAQNSLDDLNNLLFATLQNIVDPEVDEKNNPINEVPPEKLKSVVGIANAIIDSNALQLEAIKAVNKGDLTILGSDTVKQKFISQ